MPARRRALVVAGATLPALLCALIGLAHPGDLTVSTAELWRNIHLALIPVFPLIGLAPWLVARQGGRRLGWLAAVGGYGYATFYTSLDLLAGVGGGAMVLGGEADSTGPIFAIARVLARIGVWCLVAAAVVATVAAVRRVGATAVPAGLVAVVGSYLVYRGHIYFPVGTLAMLLLAGGFGALALLVTRSTTPDPVKPMAPSAR